MKFFISDNLTSEMVERVSERITLRQFQELYLLENKPCIFSSSFTEDWRSRREWVKNGLPNIEYLAEKFGSCSVPVADCNRRQSNSHEKDTKILNDFLSYWKEFIQNGGSERLLYLKDWHFQREFPDYRSYKVLEFFSSDWLNEWYDQNDNCHDDYRFVYMGPKGTWTGFHADVLRSYSWSANVCGRKKWLLYPPGEEENLKDSTGNLPFDVTSVDMEDSKMYPNFHNAVKPVEIIQEEGEIVFIPSCWHHQVHNLEHTISINHNWTNAYGIMHTLRHLETELSLVEKEIFDVREMDGWHQQCQLLLKCTAGLDYDEFREMLVDLMESRFKVLKVCRRYKEMDKIGASNEEHVPDIDFKMFKRFEITCVPKEHLKYMREGESKDIDATGGFRQEQLDLKVKEIEFDLLKLTETFLKLQHGFSENRDNKLLKQQTELVREIMNFMSINQDL